MVKTWSADNPKAALMTRKRELIVSAALQIFLENGYAESSVNRIAAEAGVSIKTLYRHFESKDDLFSAVMHAACESAGDESTTTHQLLSGQPNLPSWFNEAPVIALPIAGAEYLQHVLSEKQLALYRVVTRDAHRFPELGRRYQEEVTGKRDAVFASYLDKWVPTTHWKVADKRGAAVVFAALLTAGMLNETLHGSKVPSEDELAKQADAATNRMLGLLEAGLL
ncbi:TetR/AcrR family transcriptional regulator [Pseudomonas moorei]|uniref:TetR/AcrR family transcriptional regulator n=1 Tax=Pseudomonas moorei TaxID=395599 RepID=UPI001FF30ED3|nr:TetR/AcrR family transcriptional regulator [Pseudomonas moorei]